MSPAAPPPPDVDDLLQELGEAERLALTYAPRAVRAPLVAAFALDAALHRAALVKSEPALAQIRLAWWRDACARLPNAADHPVLAALGDSWPGDTQRLHALVDAWEGFAVAEAERLGAAEDLAEARAGVLALAARQPVSAGVLAASRCWTLAGLSAHALSDTGRAAMEERARLGRPMRLPRALRPLAILGGLGRRSAAVGAGALLGDRLSPIAALRLGILGR